MPQSYLQRGLARQGKMATLKKRQTVTYDSALKVVDTTQSTWKDIPIKYYPTSVNFKKYKLPEGWVDYMDEVIWVDPALDISKRSGDKGDMVIIGSEWYDVKYVTYNEYENHKYKMVGLKKTDSSTHE